jgi:hypothetical protein
MVKRLLPLILIQLCSCALAPPFSAPVAPVEVRVPIDRPVYCVAAAPARPALPISQLQSDSSPAATVRSYAATVVLLKGAVEERDALLAGCTAPATGSAAATSIVSQK